MENKLKQLLRNYCHGLVGFEYRTAQVNHYTLSQQPARRYGTWEKTFFL